MIKEEFLGNKSQVKIVGKPDEDFLLKVVKEEEKALEQIKKSMSPRASEEIKQMQKQLEQH